MGDRFYRQQGTSRARKYHSGYVRQDKGPARLGGSVAIEGVEDIIAVLDEFSSREHANLLRSVTHGLAGEIAKEIKKNVPVRSGNLKKSVRAKRRRSPPDAPVSDVVFTGGKYDGFYWRFVNNETKAHVISKRGSSFVSENSRRHPGTTGSGFLEKSMNAFHARKNEIVREQWLKKVSQKVKRDLKASQKRVRS